MLTKHPFGQGNGTVWMSNVECWGTEEDIAECDFSGWGPGNCNHSKDVGIACGMSQYKLRDSEKIFRILNILRNAFL